MTSDKKKPANVNVTLSIRNIQKYFDVLSSGTAASVLGKTKENAEAALTYLNDIFNSTDGDMLTVSPCGPRPKIPELT